MQNLGFTRSSVKNDHALLTPDTFIRAPFPGWSHSTHIVHVGPQLGAAFAMYTAEMQAGGRAAPAHADTSRFVYVQEGKIKLKLAQSKAQTLKAGGYAYLPPETDYTLEATDAAKLCVFEKPYEHLEGVSLPAAVVGYESEVKGQPLGGDPALMVRVLLPENPSYDMAVNTMTFAPGASLALVEVHVMEHGLLMLEGGGIYRLGESWYPVSQNDVIYMAPYCPQWFGALGKTSAKYLLYKDWSRHPLG